ncbi:MAG: hypothetical protein HAW67_00795 [Endozoicomonadaceae bacterium]|nr:hypothetical protein [Endozoicomonadaceae bacterium]
MTIFFMGVINNEVLLIHAFTLITLRHEDPRMKPLILLLTLISVFPCNVMAKDIYYYIERGDYNTVDTLLEIGIDPNITRLDESGETETPLILASKCDVSGDRKVCYEIVDDLIKYGANSSYLTNYGNSAINFLTTDCLDNTPELKGIFSTMDCTNILSLLVTPNSFSGKELTKGFANALRYCDKSILFCEAILPTLKVLHSMHVGGSLLIKEDESGDTIVERLIEMCINSSQSKYCEELTEIFLNFRSFSMEFNANHRNPKTGNSIVHHLLHDTRGEDATFFYSDAFYSLLDEYISGNFQSKLNLNSDINALGKTLLMSSHYYRDINRFLPFYDKDNLNYKDIEGNTALVVLLQNKTFDTVLTGDLIDENIRKLIDYGLDLDLVTSDGKTQRELIKEYYANQLIKTNLLIPIN